MRPLRLDLAGFTVFREPVSIDFTDADFFALVGPTGSGKSTVLDAICFALYGTVPRWGDRRAIGNALAPSATEAKVQFVFESAGARYVLTRVVRRDSKGSVATKFAGLEALPQGFDLRTLDSHLLATSLGRVLAGTPGEVEAAVAEVIGLPFEQFTKCVVLPQGEFAAFLHAKPAERQKILISLLGLDVYGKVRERANAEAAAATARATAAEQLLGTLHDADDAAVTRAASRLATVGCLVADLEALLPELAAAQTARAAATRALSELDAEISQLREVRTPQAAAVASTAARSAKAELSTAAAATTRAEELEEKARVELAAAGDASRLRGALELHERLGSLATHSDSLAATAAAAQRQYQAAAETLDQARTIAGEARGRLEAAKAAFRAAEAADQAMAVRTRLVAGHACPVCEQRVVTVPPLPRGAAVTAAIAEGEAARAALDAAERRMARCDQVARERELALATARERGAQVESQLAETRARLSGVENPETLRERLERIRIAERELSSATERVRTARSAQRRAEAASTDAAERLSLAWRGFDRARDAVAGMRPPAVERDDLAGAWNSLVAWAGSQLELRDQRRAEASAEAATAERAVGAVTDRVGALFERAELPRPGIREADPVRVASIALAEAESAHRRCLERREQAEGLRSQLRAAQREATLAKGLSGHLRANQFERWLLTEALDSLVDGASQILRELSSGQYDLGHDKGEFFVVDHHDAGLRRPVRTLSGGETFQASLSLALALSEQLAGLSTSTASLESIVLDEGFGTLDASTLDTVAATLENLAARGDRMVGVVTHVGPLAERIPVRFEVSRDARTARVERIGC